MYRAGLEMGGGCRTRGRVFHKPSGPEIGTVFRGELLYTSQMLRRDCVTFGLFQTTCPPTRGHKEIPFIQFLGVLFLGSPFFSISWRDSSFRVLKAKLLDHDFHVPGICFVFYAVLFPSERLEAFEGLPSEAFEGLWRP